jgi:hypothetical protein
MQQTAPSMIMQSITKTLSQGVMKNHRKAMLDLTTHITKEPAKRSGSET